MKKAVLISMSDKFIYPSIVLIKSLEKNLQDFDLFIGDINLSLDSKNILNQNVDVKDYLSLPQDILNKIHKTKWPKEYLVKLGVPWLISDEYDYCLCLGADMIVSGDLNSLFEIKMDQYPFAACYENSGNLRSISIFENLPEDRLYVNAETVLINLKYLRENYTINSFFDLFYGIQDEISYYDQDFLNIVFYGKIKTISPVYNYQLIEFKGNKFLGETWKVAKIIHFSSSIKPWDYRCNPWKVKLYNTFLPDEYKKSGQHTLLLSYLYLIPKIIKLIFNVIKR